MLRRQGGPRADQRHRRHARDARAGARRPAAAAARSPTSPPRCASRRCSAPTAPSPPTCMALRPQPGRRRAPRTCGGCSPARRSSPATARATRACRTPTRCAARRRCTAPRATRSRYAERVAEARARRGDRQPDGPAGRPGRVVRQLPRRAARLRLRLPRDRGRRASARSPSGAPTACSTRRARTACRRSSPTTPGVNSGLMIAQYTQAAMVAENRRLAAPASVDSLPTSAMQEDHVSMGWAAARKLRVVVDNLAPHPRGRARCAPRGARPARAARARRRHRAPLGGARARSSPGPGPTDGSSPELEAVERLRRRRARSLGAVEARRIGRRCDERSAPGARPARARSSSCRGWQQEAALRMLHEQPRSRGRRAPRRPRRLRRHRARGALAGTRSTRSCARCATLARRRDAARPVAASRSASFRTHEWAPRVLIANSNLVARLGDWDEFRRLEALGLTMYGQMTAGSWIYIGTQGILQGTYESFAEIAGARFGGSLAGHDHADRRARRHGRRAAARRHDERRRRALRRGRPAADRAPARDAATSTRQADDLDDALARVPSRRSDAGAPLSRRPARQRRRRRCPSCSTRGFAADIVTDQTARPRPARRLRARRTDARGGRAAPRASDPDEYVRAAARVDGRATARRWSASRTRAPRSSTTATACAPRRGSAASSGRSPTRASSPPTSGRCSARARARSAGSALSGDPADIAATDRAVLDVFPERRGARALDPAGRASGSRSRACRRGSAGSATASGTRSACASTRWCAAARSAAPIVIGRDHLDSGSVASPYRETEAMPTAPTRSPTGRCSTRWSTPPPARPGCRIHHGGGVGIGRSIHAGMVCVADGTRARRRRSSSGCSPTTRARASSATSTPATTAPSRSAAERGVRVPMREARRDATLRATTRELAWLGGDDAEAGRR